MNTMMKIAGAIGLGLTLTAAAASAAEPWIHVRVLGGGEKQENVRVNIPMSLVEKVLPAVESEDLRQGRIRLHEKDVRGIDLRAVWDAVRKSEDAEYVTVESEGQTLHVSKSGGYVLVKSDEAGGGSGHRSRANVSVRMPMDVVDALLSAPPGELDLQAAVKAMKSHGSGELVSIDGPDGTVRIWIDEKSESR